MDLKKLLYKMLVKYYLSDNIKASFENFALDLRNAWVGLAWKHIMVFLVFAIGMVMLFYV